MRKTKLAIAYYRVSTKRQGESGLGLEAQRATVEEYARSEGLTISAEYVEVETGKSKTRPQLLRSLAHAKRSKAVLVVAKLDRLARNVAFTSALMEAGVDFVACDNPHANRFTIHILAAVAEHEARQISVRTRDALQAAKRRGVKLGSARPGHWEGREHLRIAGLEKAREAAAKAHTEAFHHEYDDLLPVVKEWRAEGVSLRQIAARLNEQGHTTRRGKAWNATQVLRLARAG